jgi:signal transduction histidine kinase
MDITKTTRYKAVISEINFKSLIAEAAKSLQNHANAHRLEIKTTIESHLPFFNDKEQLQVIFNNIISNAIKFQHLHELNPCLNIHAEITGELITITFKDNGIGIPPQSLAKVFDMFYRIPGTKGDGAGLGLFMVKEIVKKLKGKIRIESKVGEGTSIMMELPNRIDVDLLRKFNKLIQNSK